MKKRTATLQITALSLGWLLSTQATANPPNTAPVSQAQASPGPMDAVSRLCYGGEGGEAITACQQLAAQINARPGQYDEKAFVHSRLRDLLGGQGRYREAVEAARRALAVVGKWKEPASEETWVAVTKLGNSLVNAGELEEAEKQHRLAVKHQQEASPQDPELLTTSQNNLVGVLLSRGKLEEAEQLLVRALATRESALGKDHPGSVKSQNILAEVLWKRGKLEEAEQLLRRALVTRESALGKDHPDVAQSQNNLASVLLQRGKLEEAEQLLRRALVTREAAQGKDHPDVAQSQNNLAMVLFQRGRLEEAEQLHRRALETREAALGKDHPDVAQSQNNLAEVLSQRGKLEEAEQLLRRSLATREAALGKDHPEVATSQANLAVVFMERGKLEEAEQLLRRALATRESALGKDHPRVAQSQNNLAAVLLQRRKLEEAEQLLRRSLATRETALGKDHSDVASSQNNLASVLWQRGKLEEAEQLLRRSLETTESALVKDHPDVAQIQHNMATVLFERGKLEEAEQLLRRSLAKKEAALGKDHSDVAQSQYNLAWIELQKGRLDLALDWLSKGAVIREKAIQSSPTEAYAQGLLESFQDGPMTIYGLALQSQQSEATQLALQVALMNKSRTQHVGTLVRRVLHNRLQTEPQGQRYEQMTQKLYERAKLLDQVGGKEKKEREKKLLWEAQQIEQELSQELGVRSSQSMPGLTEIIGALKAKLPKDSALAEVVIGTTRDYKRWKDWEVTEETHYIALTLYPDGTIQAVDLGRVADVHAVVGPMYQALASPQGNALAAGDAVSQKVFAKLESGLQEHKVKRLIVSGDGLLNLIPWGAVHDKQGYWAERYAIQYVSSGRDLLRPAAEVKSEAAVVLADPAAPGQRRLVSAKWVSVELSQQLGVKPLLGEDATEESLRKAHNPATMLLAAHGRFRPVPVEKTIVAMAAVAPRFSMGTLGQLRPFSRVPMEPEPIDLDNTEEGMHRSALALTPGKRPTDAKEDGYLTAEEVQQLELSGTQLVTMLACEGGIGAIGRGQGVYGLRRAFEQAGAETVVSTLWSVDEPSAAKLIQSYYNKLLKEKKGRVEAMEEAMSELRNDKEHPEYQHPYYWAPFVVTGLDGPLRIPAQAAGK